MAIVKVPVIQRLLLLIAISLFQIIIILDALLLTLYKPNELTVCFLTKLIS